MQTGKDTGIVALDVGGTSLKWSLVNLTHLDSSLPQKCFHRHQIDSQAPAETLLRAFTETIQAAFQLAVRSDLKVIGIGVSMPGPFDYEEGISLMKHKFRAIYEVNLKQELILRLNLEENYPIKFIADPIAFLLGEAYFGAVRDFQRVIGITLGTGIGSAFMVNRQILLQGKGIPPPDGGIWCLPYQGGTVEDRVSQRAILNHYRELGGRLNKDLDVDKLAFSAENGDKISLQVFEEVGSTLGEVLKPFASEFQAECIVFGGRISKSFSLFEDPLKERLQDVSGLKRIVPAELGDLSAFYGVAQEFTNFIDGGK